MTANDTALTAERALVRDGTVTAKDLEGTALTLDERAEVAWVLDGIASKIRRYDQRRQACEAVLRRPLDRDLAAQNEFAIARRQRLEAEEATRAARLAALNIRLDATRATVGQGQDVVRAARARLGVGTTFEYGEEQ